MANPGHYDSLTARDWRADCGHLTTQWYIDSRENPLPDSDALQSSLERSEHNPTTDANDSLSLHSALEMLTPQQAADHRLWVGLAHFELYEYVRRRWALPQRSKSTESANLENKRQNVRIHWFVRGARGLVRDNGISRLWWMGRILKLIAQETRMAPAEVGEILFELTDVRAQLIERPATASNIRLAAEITSVLRSERGLIERQPFRRWMIALNQLGGIILLDALRRDDLRRVVHEQANLALRS